jgi:hypothetical protein
MSNAGPLTGLFVMAIAIPELLWLTWRRNADGARDDNHLSFRNWVGGEFEIWTNSVKGVNATAEILLPIAAVAVGMTVLGISVSHDRERRRLILPLVGALDVPLTTAHGPRTGRNWRELARVITLNILQANGRPSWRDAKPAEMTMTKRFK